MDENKEFIPSLTLDPNAASAASAACALQKESVNADWDIKSICPGVSEDFKTFFVVRCN